MTGPEHYRRAEALLDYARNHAFSDVDDQGRTVEEYDDDNAMNLVAAAQVHATLALAAANALIVSATQPPQTTKAGIDWRAAISPPEQEPK